MRNRKISVRLRVQPHLQDSNKMKSNGRIYDQLIKKYCKKAMQPKKYVFLKESQEVLFIFITANNLPSRL